MAGAGQVDERGARDRAGDQFRQARVQRIGRAAADHGDRYRDPREVRAARFQAPHGLQPDRQTFRQGKHPRPRLPVQASPVARSAVEIVEIALHRLVVETAPAYRGDEVFVAPFDLLGEDGFAGFAEQGIGRGLEQDHPVHEVRPFQRQHQPDRAAIGVAHETGAFGGGVPQLGADDGGGRRGFVANRHRRRTREGLGMPISRGVHRDGSETVPQRRGNRAPDRRAARARRLKRQQGRRTVVRPAGLVADLPPAAVDEGHGAVSRRS